MSAAQHGPLNAAYYEKLLKLQQLNFATVELGMYLDTHPNDLQAIQQFNQLSREQHQSMQQFEIDYGPLMNAGHSYSKFPWQWVETPWPWQV